MNNEMNSQENIKTDVQLSIDFINHDDIHEIVLINVNKQCLVQRSKYFNSLLTNDYVEKNKDNINISLEHLGYNYDGKNIRLLFDSMSNYQDVQYESKRNIKITIETQSDIEAMTMLNIDINVGVKNVNVHEIYELLSLCEYFACDDLDKLIRICLDNYKLLLEDLLVYDVVEPVVKPVVKTSKQVEDVYCLDDPNDGPIEDEDESPVVKPKAKAKAKSKSSRRIDVDEDDLPLIKPTQVTKKTIKKYECEEEEDECEEEAEDEDELPLIKPTQVTQKTAKKYKYEKGEEKYRDDLPLIKPTPVKTKSKENENIDKNESPLIKFTPVNPKSEETKNIDKEIKPTEIKPTETNNIPIPYNYTIKPTIDEKCELIFNDVINIDKKILEKELDYYRSAFIINHFLQNIYHTYISYKNADKVNIFKQIMNIISQAIDTIKPINKYKYLADFCPKIEGVVLTMEELKQLPFEICYDFLHMAKNVVTLSSKIYKLYDFYDILNYEPTSWETFKCKDMDINYENGKKCVHSKDDVIRTFHEKTNNMFKNINWSNIILTGGFPFGLVNNLSDGFLNSTDIDLFIYGGSKDETDIVDTKMKYLLDYFSQYNPIYSKRGKVVTIIIPSFPFDIQLIPSGELNPYDVINNFDFTYIQMYYDGSDIYITFDCLLSIKHNVTMYKNLEYSVKTDRLYKTVKKGLHIKYSEHVKNVHIDSDVIHYDRMLKDKTMNVYMNKSNIVRKIIKCVDLNKDIDEIAPIIKTYYKSRYVTQDVLRLVNTKDDDYEGNNNNDGYGSLTKRIRRNIIDIDNIDESNFNIIKSLSNRNFTWGEYVLKNKTILKKITIETDYCSIRSVSISADRDGNSNMEIILDKKTADKLLLLQDKTIKIFKNKKLKHKTIDNLFRESDNRMTVHLDKTHKNYKKLLAFVKELDVTKDRVKVRCNGQLWMNGGVCGIKFKIDDLKCETVFDML